MLDVSVKFDLEGPRTLLNNMKRGIGDKAVLSILNKTTAQAKTRMSQAIRAEYNISAALVNERLRIRRATRKDIVTFSATLIGNPETGGTKRSMNLVHFLEKNAQIKAFRRGKSWRLDDLRFKVRKAGGSKPCPAHSSGTTGGPCSFAPGKHDCPSRRSARSACRRCSTRSATSRASRRGSRPTCHASLRQRSRTTRAGRRSDDAMRKNVAGPSRSGPRGCETTAIRN